MGFPASGLAEEQEGRPSLTKRRVARSWTSFLSMEGWKVKSNSSMVLRAGRERIEPGGEAAVAGGGALGGDHVGQVDHWRPVLGHGLFGHGGEALGGGVELQVAEVVLELLVRRRAGGHRARCRRGRSGTGRWRRRRSRRREKPWWR